jgi:hypothetical protein
MIIGGFGCADCTGPEIIPGNENYFSGNKRVY